MKQLEKLKKLVQRKNGVMSWEIAQRLPSVTPSRRISDLRDLGWTITHKMAENGQKIYFGKPPKV